MPSSRQLSPAYSNEVIPTSVVLFLSTFACFVAVKQTLDYDERFRFTQDRNWGISPHSYSHIVSPQDVHEGTPPPLVEKRRGSKQSGRTLLHRM